MYINGADILSSYHAKLLNKDIQPAEITIFDDWLRNAVNPLYLGKQEKFKTIKMQILVTDTTDNLCQYHISNLVSQLKQCEIKFDDLDFYFMCTLNTVSSARLVTPGYYVLDIEMKSGYAYLAEVTETLSNIDHVHFTVLGNLPSPAIVTLTTNGNQSQVVLSGFEVPITIKNLLANTPVVIDGVACTVLQNGGNKFADTDMWAFPILLPGAMTLTTSISSVIISVKYKPKFM